jgi:transposase
LIEIIKKIKIIDRQVIIVEKENTLIHKQTIKEIETGLSKYNSRVNNYDDFEKYLIEKNKTNSKIFEYYEQKLFRKFKLNSFTNTQKSESKMLNNFKKKFGDGKDTIFVIGDYDKGSNQMHGVEPTILKRIRRLFKNAGYPVYLINEFCTSKICNYCNGELEKFLTRMSKKPKDIIQKKQITVHGLLRCTNVTPQCKQIHNRDKNAVQNMLHIVSEIFKTGKRPAIFSRTN